MPPFPISRYLVPDQPPAVPAGFTALRQALTGGLPQRIELGAGLHAVLVLPTGLARQWLDADPLDVVSTSSDDLAPRPAPEAPDPVPLAARAPLRLVVRRGTQVLGSVPLSAGLRRACADGGAAGQGTAVEIAVVAWHLCAGTVRGPGDYGSFVSLGWRQADLAMDVFGPPPVHRFVVRRLPPDLRVESDLGQEPDEDELRDLTLSKRLRRLAQ
jgi:hypothetical protein